MKKYNFGGTKKKKMDKKELFELVKQKSLMKETELNSLYDESVKLMKEKFSEKVSAGQISDAEIEKYALARMYARLKQQMSSPAKKFEGIILGATGIVDYGRKQREEALKVYDENPDRALAEGYVDENGNPLYRYPDFKRGKVIADDDVGRQLIMVAKEDGEVEYRKTLFSLRGSKAGEPITFFKKVSFRANISNKSTENELLLNQSSATSFVVLSDEQVNIKNIVPKYFGDNLSSIESLKSWHRDRSEDYNRFVFVLGNVVRINLTGEGKSNVVELTGESLSIDEDVDTNLTCWISEETDINFSEDAFDVIVCGRTNETQEGKIQLQSYGLFCPEMWQIKKDSLPVETKSVGVEQNKSVAEEDW